MHLALPVHIKVPRYVSCNLSGQGYTLPQPPSLFKTANHRRSGRRHEGIAVREKFVINSKGNPRYAMIAHIAPKFEVAREEADHEARAAIILNRFTRTLTVMYATHSLEDILDVAPEDFIGKSFFECISEDCLDDAIYALESAKENDSIAYLRFVWRNPGGGRSPSGSATEVSDDEASEDGDGEESGSTDPGNSATISHTREPNSPALSAQSPEIEVEAVVSCTSDGLVVILRRATGPRERHGYFAAPWANRAHSTPSSSYSSIYTGVSTSKLQPRDQNLMEAITKVAVFAWSLRSLNSDVVTKHATPGKTLPDSSETVGDFVEETRSYWKRAREWEGMSDEEEKEEEENAKGLDSRMGRRISMGRSTRDPQYPSGRKDKDETHNNKRRATRD